MNRLSPFAFAGAMLATSLTVLSASPVQAAAMRVHYGDLDLGTAAGRATIDARISTAAHSVCRGENDGVFAAADCRRASIANAHAALDRATRDQQVQLASR